MRDLASHVRTFFTGIEQRREYRRRGAWMNYGPQAHELAEARAEHGWLERLLGIVCSRR